MKKNFEDVIPGGRGIYNLSLIAEDGGGLESSAIIKIEIVPPEALRSDFTTISLLGGIFAGAMTVLIIFIALLVIFKRRKRRMSQINKHTNYKVSKAGYPDWAIEGRGPLQNKNKLQINFQIHRFIELNDFR